MTYANGKALRQAIREKGFTSHTSGEAPGFVQANLVILRKDWAWDFFLFAQRNPKACPILEVGEPGQPFTRFLADKADIQTDIPRYRIYEHGVFIEEVEELSNYETDFVFFLLGCSFTFEYALMQQGLELRHITEGCNVPMYNTRLLCIDAGRFHASPMVVSMRPFSPADAIKAVEITSQFPAVHGAPVHLGDPALIGICDISKPDYGDPVTLKDGELPVFWACGVTPQKAALLSKPDIMITHAPGCMFVSDLPITKLGK